MNFKNQGKFLRITAKITLIGLFFCGLCLVEPVLRDKVIFAVTYFDHPKVSEESLKPIKVVNIKPIHVQTTPIKAQKSHAPEPSSLFIILSGIAGMTVRFAQRSFEKFKRASDYFLAILGLVILSPLFVLAGIFIRLDSEGPVIYRQNRVGKKGKVFKIYKFRTMRVDAEKGTGAVWAKKNDSRVTRIGKVLRKAHIDEIPQLFNVINGDMSIVGPRPERPEIVRDLKVFIHDYEKRLQVKPGITGLAQVVHKYDETIEDVKKKIKYDLLYIKKMCWLVEARILARTFIVALTGKGAR